jgi:hypothetical protein
MRVSELAAVLWLMLVIAAAVGVWFAHRRVRRAKKALEETPPHAPHEEFVVRVWTPWGAKEAYRGFSGSTARRVFESQAHDHDRRMEFWHGTTLRSVREDGQRGYGRLK